MLARLLYQYAKRKIHKIRAERTYKQKLSIQVRKYVIYRTIERFNGFFFRLFILKIERKTGFKAESLLKFVQICTDDAPKNLNFSENYKIFTVFKIVLF